MAKLYYPAVFHECDADETGYWVEFPDLPGCCTQGDTIEEAVEMAKDALGTWFLPDQTIGKLEYPTPSKPNELRLETPSDFVVLIEYDSIAWAKRHNNKSIKKTLTIPAWLEELAKKENVNYSQTLQDALIKKLGL